VNLSLYERYGAESVRAGYTERAHRHVGATLGWRGALAALSGAGRMRWRSSRASRLDHP